MGPCRLNRGATVGWKPHRKPTAGNRRGAPVVPLCFDTLGVRPRNERFGRSCDGCFYFPYDVRFAVKRCLEKINPALVVFIETDIWPGFLADVRRNAVPCLLVNGRLSPESFRTYRTVSALFKPAFNTFRWIYPQSPGEADRFLALGIEPGRLRTPGNLKFDAAPPIPADALLAALRKEFYISA